MFDRPLGIEWDEEKMIYFLKKRGYLILSRQDPDTYEPIKVATKKDGEVIEEEDNIKEVFKSELQLAILEKLL